MSTPSSKEVAQNPIRLLVVEDDEQLQQALKDAIELHPAFQLIAQAFTLEEGLVEVKRCKPDVALIDLGLPDGNGLELIRYFHQHLPNCESMVLTVFCDESNVISSIKAGATGYLTKDTRIPEILERIKQLHAGGSPISPMIARRMLGLFRDGQQPAVNNITPDSSANSNLTETTFTPLSEREQEVLEMVAKGFTQAEIADILTVSVNTVSTYVKRIYKKLAVSSRTSAVHRASALGLLNLKDR